MNRKREIHFEIDGETHTIGIEGPIFREGSKVPGARMTKSLLMTEALDDFRAQLWNQGIDLIESGMIVYTVNGGDITKPDFYEMIKCQVTMLKRRLGL